MRILLINPPRRNAIRSEAPAVVREEGGKYPALGLMYLEAYVKARSDYEVELLDADACDMDYPALTAAVAERRPELVGVTALTHGLADVVKTLAAVREAAPAAHVTVGGPHVNAFTEHATRLDADSLVVGDGEETFLDLARALDAGRGLEGIPGLRARRSDGSWSPLAARPPVADLDSLPFPDRSHDHARFYNVMGEESVVTTLVTSRGCPFRCTFCSTPREHYRERSAESVVAEMLDCLDQGIGEVYIVDDTFNVRPERVLEICDRLIDAGREVKWSCRLRIDRTTPELLERMKAAGCNRVQYGVETSTDEGLEVLGKGITVEQVRRVVGWTKRIGLPCAAYFMIGCPHERTREDVLRTIRFAVELDTDLALFNVLTPMPGSRLHAEGVERGILTARCWERFFEEPSAEFKPEVWEEHLSRAELYELLDLAYRRFYLRPRVVLRRLWGLRSWRQLRRQARAALRLIAGGE